MDVIPGVYDVAYISADRIEKGRGSLTGPDTAAGLQGKGGAGTDDRCVLAALVRGVRASPGR